MAVVGGYRWGVLEEMDGGCWRRCVEVVGGYDGGGEMELKRIWKWTRTFFSFTAYFCAFHFAEGARTRKKCFFVLYFVHLFVPLHPPTIKN